MKTILCLLFDDQHDGVRTRSVATKKPMIDCTSVDDSGLMNYAKLGLHSFYINFIGDIKL